MAGLPLAVLIDGENVAAGRMVSIMARADQLGNPAARCVVGDFSGNRLAEWVWLAHEHALELVFQPSCGKGRNSADIALTIRAMDLLAMNVFRRFLIVSSDSDFAPLAQRLRRTGAAVFGMGVAKPDSAWRTACTAFYDLDAKPAATPAIGAISKPAAAKSAAAKSVAAGFVAAKFVAAKSPAPKQVAAKPQPPATRPQPSRQDREAVRTILRRTAEDSPWLPLSDIGQLIRRNSLDLSARVCGNGRLLKHLRADPLVELRERGKSLEARLRERAVSPPPPPLLTIVARAGG